MDGCERWSQTYRDGVYKRLEFFLGFPNFPEEAKAKVRALRETPLPPCALQPLASPEMYNIVPVRSADGVDYGQVRAAEAQAAELRVGTFEKAVRPYGFFECEKVACLSGQGLVRLLNLMVVEEGVDYAVAMLVGVLDFDKECRKYPAYDDNGKETSWNKTLFFRLLQKALPSAAERRIKGNFNILRNVNSMEKETCYKAKTLLPRAWEDYREIAGTDPREAL